MSHTKFYVSIKNALKSTVLESKICTRMAAVYAVKIIIK
eukprot:SAG31_NODE_1075_length_10048_cov_21.627701_10_plen_39_part_00